MRSVDGFPRFDPVLHTGIAVFPNPGGENSARRRIVGQAPGRRSRLQVRNRRNTGELLYASIAQKI